MKKIVLLFGILTLLGFSINKKVTTVKKVKKSYYPIAVGNYWVEQFAQSEDTLLIKIVSANHSINSKSYLKVERFYTWGQSPSDYTRFEDGTLYSYDEKTKGESVSIPNKLKIGTAWVQYDTSWKYEVMNLNGSVTTPINSYKNLLVIKAHQLTSRDKNRLQQYTLYFKKGIGKIATYGNGKLFTYLKSYKLN